MHLVCTLLSFFLGLSRADLGQKRSFAKGSEFVLVSLGEGLGVGFRRVVGGQFSCGNLGKRGRGWGGKSMRKLCRNYPLANYPLVSPLWSSACCSFVWLQFWSVFLLCFATCPGLIRTFHIYSMDSGKSHPWTNASVGGTLEELSGPLVHTNFPRKRYGPMIGPCEFPYRILYVPMALKVLWKFQSWLVLVHRVVFPGIEVNMRKSGMIGFVRDGFGSIPWTGSPKISLSQ